MFYGDEGGRGGAGTRTRRSWSLDSVVFSSSVGLGEILVWEEYCE